MLKSQLLITEAGIYLMSMLPELRSFYFFIDFCFFFFLRKTLAHEGRHKCLKLFCVNLPLQVIIYDLWYYDIIYDIIPKLAIVTWRVHCERFKQWLVLKMWVRYGISIGTFYKVFSGYVNYILSPPVADPGFPRGGHQPSRGCQHTILAKFPKNCMKLKEFRPWRG